jgi:hypothetical protein
MHMVVVLLILLAGLALYATVLAVLVGLCRDSARGDAALASAYAPPHEASRLSA